MILLRKTIRDILHQRAQFFAIFIMIFLGVFIYTGVNSEWNGMRYSSQKLYQETNMADVFVYSSNIQQRDVEAMKKELGNEEVERRAVLPTTMSKDKKISLYIEEENQISQMYLVKGKAYDKHIDGIWLDSKYASENKMTIGNKITLSYGDITIQKTIVGLVYHPEYVYMASDANILPDHKNTGFAVISANFLEPMQKIQFTQMLIKSKDVKGVEKAMYTVFSNRDKTMLERHDLPSYEMLENEIIQHQAFGNIFPIVFLLIALLTTMTTVSKMMLHQRLQIGILKAVGFSNRRVLVHYVSHILCITLLAAMLGCVIGPLVVPQLIYPMLSASYVLPEWIARPYAYSLLLVFACVVLCFLAAFGICHKQLKDNAAATLRPAVRKEQHAINQSRGTLWKRLSFYAQWNVRDIFRNKIRSLMAVIGIAGCMGLLFCAFGLRDTVNNLMDSIYGDMQRFAMRVEVSENADMQAIQNKMDGEMLMEGAVELQANEQTENASLSVQESTTYIKLKRKDNYQDIALPKTGLLLSYKLANTLNVEKGSLLQWRLLGNTKWQQTRIEEIIYTPTVQGITMSKDVYEKQGFPYQPKSIIGKRVELNGMEGIKTIHYMADMKANMNAFMDGMNLMIVVLMVGAIVLGIVVLYNITTFAYIEKIREMATLKVLGFRNRSVKKLLRQQNLWLTLCGMVAGVPFGYYLIYVIFSTTGDSMDFRIVINGTTLFLCFLGTLAISMFTVWLVSRRVKDIDMVEALKAIE